jgi:ribosomal protein S18 acetylase RimI-like enzyme
MKLLSPVHEPVIGPGPTCRQAAAADIVALVELDRLCFDRRAWPVRAWWEVVTFPEWTALVLVEGDELTAASVLLPAAPVSWLASIAVHPARRRRGCARALLRRAVRDARAASARWLSLEVDRVNRAALRLYREEGFGTARRFREEGRIRLEMVRRLRRAPRRPSPHPTSPRGRLAMMGRA